MKEISEKYRGFDIWVGIELPDPDNSKWAEWRVRRDGKLITAGREDSQRHAYHRARITVDNFYARKAFG